VIRYLLIACVLTYSSSLESIEVIWPTSMDRRTIHSFDDFIQPTASEKITSGCFGMVRENGHRFHEGVDIRPSMVNNNGEATDRIFSAMAGQVAYINQGLNGPYGKYIILFHPQAEVPVYTLYAHLAVIDQSLRVGDAVPRGKPIAIMGHTSIASSPIPKDRAHLHFEVGLRLSDSFNQWYKEKFGKDEAPNIHGVWNGQNLTGFDPTNLLASTNVNVADVIRALPTALAVTVRTNQTPDFVKRYPKLVVGDPNTAAGWYIEFTWHGMPKRWTALPAGSSQLPSTTFEIAGINNSYRDSLVLRKILTTDGRSPGENLIQNVQILFANCRN
jgi:hypothetical protein